MPLHLIKLSVGSENISDIENWVKRRSKLNHEDGRGRVHDHVTRMFPKRQDELLNGGSIFWVIKGQILVRQRLLRFETVTGDDQINRCAIIIDPKIHPTEPFPRKAFQGWRYLKAEDAPRDLADIDVSKGAKAPPPALRAELADLGLL